VHGAGKSFGELLGPFPRFAQAGCVEVQVRENEMLYLPNSWYHAASQSELTIAVNCWHDMVMDQRWGLSEYLKAVSKGGKK
jgi:hypothetical protein